METGMKNEIRIVEANVNDIPQWRIYINQELKRMFPTKEQAEDYVNLLNKDKKK
jgi:hypothetical protein